MQYAKLINDNLIQIANNKKISNDQEQVFNPTHQDFLRLGFLPLVTSNPPSELSEEDSLLSYYQAVYNIVNNQIVQSWTLVQYDENI